MLGRHIRRTSRGGGKYLYSVTVKSLIVDAAGMTSSVQTH